MDIDCIYCIDNVKWETAITQKHIFEEGISRFSNDVLWTLVKYSKNSFTSPSRSHLLWRIGSKIAYMQFMKITVINSAIRFQSFLHPALIIYQTLNEFIWNSIRANSISTNSFIGFSNWLQFIGLIVKEWSLKFAKLKCRNNGDVAACGGLCTLMVQGRCPWSRRRFGLRGNFGRIERPLNSIEIIHSAKYLYRRALFSRREGWKEEEVKSRRRRRIFGGFEDEEWEGRKGREVLAAQIQIYEPTVDAHLETPPSSLKRANVGIVREPRLRVPRSTIS